MVDINVNKLSEALNGKADIDLNNTGVFSTSNGGGVNLSVSTPSGAESKEVVSADYVGNKTTAIEAALTSQQEILNTCFKKTTDDKSDLSGIGMPSSKYIDLTSGASGTEYVAPANGWVFLLSQFTAANSYIQLKNLSTAIREQTPAITTSGWWGITIAVRKGDSFALYYDTTPRLGFFRFHYAEGEV